VGSFKEGMKGLHDRNLIPLIRMEVLKKKKPLLGICLGMQLLASEGFEYGHHEGLGFIPGKVVEVDVTQSHLRLPHIGWNDVRIVGDHLVACNFTIPPVFYFVHSFQFVPQDASVIAGVTDYGGDIVAILQSGNICGVQFHPEKSHEDGLKIFKNFLTL
jgi:glutamine amidotransferase